MDIIISPSVSIPEVMPQRISIKSKKTPGLCEKCGNHSEEILCDDCLDEWFWSCYNGGLI